MLKKGWVGQYGKLNFMKRFSFMDDSSLIRLLEYFNLSWSGYRKVRKGVKKRIARHMQALNLSFMDDYLELIDKDENVRKICFWYLSVSISRFYRDRNLWDGLGWKILPALLCTFSNAPKFKVWSCGCARGEEAYSFLMLWESLKNSQYQMPDLEIIATDMNPEYLKMAMEGTYESRSLKELPKLFIEKYFTKIPAKNKYQFHSHLKDMVILKQHNFMEEPPPSEEFHLIFARNNLLTYYNFPEKAVAFLKIINTLETGGAIIIGSHEKVPDNIFSLKRHTRLPWLYFKKKQFVN
jgi:chemotaxis protein methyltransferase CheR